MATFGMTLGVILLAIAGLSLGVMLGRPPIKGSCGGLACVPGVSCSACPKRTGSDGGT